jgi:dUTP pyrophosphatase
MENRLRGFEPVKQEMQHFPNTITIMPTRGSGNSAGYDFYLKSDIFLYPNTELLVMSDVKAYMQDDEVLNLFIRSSIGRKKRVTLSNSVAVIDADYYENPDNDGNIGFSLVNNTSNPIVLKAGERIAQGVFSKYLLADGDEATGERNSGFGSTGL